MIYILGIITGLILAIIVFLASHRYEAPVHRTIKQLSNLTKEKGEVFIETDENREIEQLIDNLKQE